MNNVATIDGQKKTTPDSKIGFGEVWFSNPVNGLVEEAKVETKGSRVGKDDVYAKTEGYGILGNDTNLETGNTFAQDAYTPASIVQKYNKWQRDTDKISQALGTGYTRRKSAELMKKMAEPAQRRLADLADSQEKQHAFMEYTTTLRANRGKDVKHLKFGQDQLGNIITSGVGILGGLGQIINANGQSLNSPTIYTPNQYEQQALTTLAGLRDNPYNQLRAMQDLESRNRYGVSQSGGLTGGQKYLANVASGIGMQKNYADVLYRSNQANNQYKSAWATAAMQAGLANAQRMQASNQYRDEAYARSHAAREQMRQMGMQNMLGQMQQYYANEFKRRQFEKMMDLYWAEQNAKYPNIATYPQFDAEGYPTDSYINNNASNIAKKRKRGGSSNTYTYDLPSIRAIGG